MFSFLFKAFIFRQLKTRIRGLPLTEFVLLLILWTVSREIWFELVFRRSCLVSRTFDTARGHGAADGSNAFSSVQVTCVIRFPRQNRKIYPFLRIIRVRVKL